MMTATEIKAAAATRNAWMAENRVKNAQRLANLRARTAAKKASPKIGRAHV